MTNKKVPKSSDNYYCEECNYSTSRQSQYNRHILTPKHKILTDTNKKVPKSSKVYECECGKSYKHASSLCGHKKKCSINQEEINLNTNEIEPTKNF